MSVNLQKYSLRISLLSRSLGKQVSPPNGTGVEHNYIEKWHLLAYLSMGFLLAFLALVVESSFKWVIAHPCAWVAGLVSLPSVTHGSKL